MIIPCLYLKQGNLVDPSSGQSVQDVSSCLQTISLCPECAIVALDTEKETIEFAKYLVGFTSCSAEYEADNVDELLDLLDSGANRVVLDKNSLNNFGQFVSKERITCKLSDATIATSSVEELRKEIDGVKERTSSFLLSKNVSQVDEASLVESAKEIKNFLCGDARLILSVNLNEVISCTAISQLQNLGVDVQISATCLLNELSLGQIIASCLKSDRPDGLYPTLVVSGEWYKYILWWGGGGG